MPLFNFFKSSPEERFSRFIQPHLQRLYHHAYRLTQNQDDAEDLVQELLLRLYEKNIDFSSIEKPVHWLIRSLFHQFVDNYRKKSRLPVDEREFDSDEIIDSLANEQQSPEQINHQAYTGRQLQQALQTLNPDQQSLIALHDIEGYSLPELSEILDTPVGTLKSRLHRARQSLRDEIGLKSPDLMEPFHHDKRVNG